MRRLLILCALGMGCGGTDPKSTSGPPASDDPPPDSDALPGVDHPEVGTVPELEPSAPSTRQRKRMTVTQVRDSMEAITGGVRWGDRETSDWDSYAATLGVADYQTRTTTDLTPSVLFQKFLDDAAVQTCAQWLSEETTTFHRIDDPTSTELSEVRSNVAGARWRIQGRPLHDDDPIVEAYVDLWADVYRSTESTEEAWNTVCVALFTHPDFFMY